MIKKEYLSIKDVTDFCNWFADNLESDLLAHSWGNRRTHHVMEFQHIYDAYNQYEWQFNLRLPDKPSCNGSSFNENYYALKTLKSGLHDAVMGKNDSDTLAWTHSILRWGGVFPKNGRWLIKNQAGLAAYFNDRAEYLGKNSDDTLLGELSRFNSGMTKIYSLLVDDFIIYDTRVAAALGWVVVKYCQEKKLEKVPESLRFPWGTAKEAPNTLNPKQRNPSVGHLKFPRLQSGSEYARWNLRASWLLWDVINKTQSCFKGIDNSLRALEAALFMIGYDLGNLASDQTAIIAYPDTESAIDIITDQHSYRCRTRGYEAIAKKFRYEYTDTNILIRNENSKEHLFENHKAVEILNSLYQQFGNNWFPLGNNVEKLGKGTEIPGLGRTILDAYPGNIKQAQAASYFGPIMEDMGLFEWNGKNRGIAWRLTCEPLIQLPEIDN